MAASEPFAWLMEDLGYRQGAIVPIKLTGSAATFVAEPARTNQTQMFASLDRIAFPSFMELMCFSIAAG
ncbi:hypothetical protein RBSWK_03228 [Rhodopirellula baltica SWK14]|uniref:Uncharacterized protein n=1 Tax=Rhodopirellula baltica SWK14 TaxID=993516 RepID=L7CI71_RHOBT|nr:hypothetical protein RBSWK_03228 [Rhodopirellula baltica SWK14]